jgi:nucleotide-binding universal stress UspA family protein
MGGGDDLSATEWKPPEAERARPAGFQTIACGVDGSEPALEAVRQASLLAPGGRLTLISVAHQGGAGLTEQASLSPQRAHEAIERAKQVAEPLGVTTSEMVIESRDAAAVLLREGETHDLVAVAARREEPRVAGILLGAVPAALTHRAHAPVLLARRPQADAEFPRHILVASDDSEDAERAMRLAAAIAREHDSRVTVLRVVRQRDPSHRRTLAEHAAEWLAEADPEPTLLVEEGEPADTIVECAARAPTSLIVIGSRGLGGVWALESVSERVAHRAPCSVLVARPPGT